MSQSEKKNLNETKEINTFLFYKKVTMEFQKVTEEEAMEHLKLP